MTEQESLDIVRGLVEQTIAEWNMEATVEASTGLIGDLGFTSIDVIDVMASMELKLGRKLPYDQLIAAPGGGYREELTVGDVAEFVFAHQNVDRGAHAAI